MKVSTLVVLGVAGLTAAAPMYKPVSNGVVVYMSTVNGKAVRIFVNGKNDASPEFPAVRLGHAAANANTNNMNDAKVQPPPALAISHAFWPVDPTDAAMPQNAHKGCGGFTAKMNRITDKARELLGLPPIDRSLTSTPLNPNHPAWNTKSYPGPMDVDVDEMRILPFWGLGGAPAEEFRTFTFAPGRNKHFLVEDGKPAYHHHPHTHFKHDRFVNRLHRAMNQLGPWEGRAVSFVLGCGIGVLLRMFFVLAILLVRSRRSRDEQQTVVGPIHLPVQQEVIFVAPPEYFVDEKVDSSLYVVADGQVVDLAGDEEEVPKSVA